MDRALAHKRISCMFQMDGFQTRSGLSRPEIELMRAVLVNAIMDLKTKGRDKKSALFFFNSEEKEYLFSFSSICGYLALDPQKAKEAILSGRKMTFEKRRNRYKTMSLDELEAA